ncbi:hypothetical protein [Permianibacter aggregans]|uniref:Uncharacterized protein n=1 Tax=Permianibacter aggregans TaxID=1510150 RepID=A0A4R6UJ27_9GAMM|nr:hypothetical protein [Permianibacter aggregans]QGX38487.1 hypothetical protein E2H98_01910 [Permianibacter aggregans]TDQ45045.1 hypothetical protein EV696_1213 [Permianibacter aggregans]
MLSAFEHLVPEQLFSTPQKKAEGVSAVKAIAIANGQGQRIYTINQSNLETALSQITLDIDTENDIRAAVGSGKQVTTHQNPITYHGWTGAGYIITDTESGAGAYKISGGADGNETMLEEASGMIVSAWNDSKDFLQFFFEFMKKFFGKALRGLSDVLELWEAWNDCPAMEFVLVAVFIFVALMMSAMIFSAYGLFLSALVGGVFGYLASLLKNERC